MLGVVRMEHPYPAGPSAVPPDLTKPTSAYRRHAYIAIVGLLLFLVGYLALASWFSWTAYRLLPRAGSTENLVVAVAGGAAAAFLYRLADEARAPRPRRVYLSPDVNAAVFFDFSFVNLIFPSRKNLVIGRSRDTYRRRLQ